MEYIIKDTESQYLYFFHRQVMSSKRPAKPIFPREDASESSSLSGHPDRALAAKALIDAALQLKQEAERGDFKMIAYLLDLVVLEADDYIRSATGSARAKDGQES